MRIAIDARAISWTGVVRYVRNLVGELVRIESEDEYVLLVGGEDLERLREDEIYKSDRVSLFEVDKSYYSLKEQTVMLWQLQRVQADLFHFTHFNVPSLFNRPYVVTAHDATRFVYSGQTKQDLFSQVAYELVFQRAMERAKAVISVSEATKKDLEELPFELPKTVVIKEGVDQAFSRDFTGKNRNAIRDFLGFDEDYLLYVGVWMEHKNLRRMLEAFALARQKGLNAKLVVTGEKKKGYVDVPKLARAYGLVDEVVNPDFVSHELLPALYAESVGCLFPSLYEGFGLPPLEALASGTPVIASQVTSLPEVLGDGAWYVNPEDVEGLAEAILGIVGDIDKRQVLVVRGRKRVEEFSWVRAAADHLSLYRSVLE